MRGSLVRSGRFGERRRSAEARKLGCGVCASNRLDSFLDRRWSILAVLVALVGLSPRPALVAARPGVSGSTRGSQSASRTTTGRRSRTCCGRTARPRLLHAARPLIRVLAITERDPRSVARLRARVHPAAYAAGRSLFDSADRRRRGSCSSRSRRTSPTTARRRGCTRRGVPPRCSPCSRT
jgi:hypothetical protein